MNSLGSLASQDHTENTQKLQELSDDDTSSYASGDINTSEGESDDEENEDALKKLERNIQKEFLLEHHPEIKQINYEELEALSTVTRDDKGQIIDKLHTTLPFLTKYEKTRILGIRCKQINNGSQIFVTVNEKILDGYTIACLELKEKKLPFIIQRPLPNGACEYWKINDLELIN